MSRGQGLGARPTPSEGAVLSILWNPAIQRWFRPAGVAALVREQQAGGNASRAIWGLMQIAIWHRIFVEGQTPRRDEEPLDWIA